MKQNKTYALKNKSGGVFFFPSAKRGGGCDATHRLKASFLFFGSPFGHESWGDALRPEIEFLLEPAETSIGSPNPWELKGK